MRPKRIIAASAAAGVMLCGCGRKVTNGCADELKGSSWATDGIGAHARLTFDGDCAALTIESAGETSEISGLCVVDDGRIVILDDSDKYIFGYSLAGKTLTLTYGKDSAALYKE